MYIGGVPRSGSTLTDLMMHRLPGHFAVGELHYLWRNGVLLNGLCSCENSFTDCPFWSEVGRIAYGGWDRLDIDHIMKLIDSVDRTDRIPLILSPRRPASFERRLAEYKALLVPLYRAIVTVSGSPVVVDSSKRPSLAFILAATDDIDLSIVHVLRDPRGVAFSFAKHVELVPGASNENTMPQRTTRKVGRQWVTVNGLISLLGAMHTPHLRVRYEDLVAEPRVQMQRVARFEGIADADLDLSWLTDAGMVVPQTHVVAGGRIRLHEGVMPLRIDDAWQREMPTGSRVLVSAMTWASRWRYGYL
jgi:hypothetical protein